MIDAALIADLMKAVRATSDVAKAEVDDLANAALLDMNMRGVYPVELDGLVKQAIKLYCKSNYGYDKDTDRFQKAYEALVASMALSGDYVGG